MHRCAVAQLAGEPETGKSPRVDGLQLSGARQSMTLRCVDCAEAEREISIMRSRRSLLAPSCRETLEATWSFGVERSLLEPVVVAPGVRVPLVSQGADRGN